jgi:ribokinase
MLLALGNDAFAVPLLESLTSAGVQLHAVRVPEPTGTAFICVSDDGENAITVAPGANHALLPQHLTEQVLNWQGITHLLMQLETPLPTVLACAQAARTHGVQVVLNAAPAQALPSALLALVDLLIVNEGELAALTQPHGSVAEQLAQLQVPCVVVTLGGKGCLARVDGQLIEQASYPVTVVDTTGAGDTFCGALVAALARQAGANASKLSMAQALQEASAAAALACTQLGAQSSIPTRHAVAQLMQQSSHG